MASHIFYLGWAMVGVEMQYIGWCFFCGYDFETFTDHWASFIPSISVLECLGIILCQTCALSLRKV